MCALAVTSMDRIEFRIVGSGEDPSIAIFINGNALVELLREYELPMATAEGHPTLAGGYKGVPASCVVQHAEHFLGEPEPMFEQDEKTVVLVCGSCGEPGCWPLLVKIDVSDEQIVWCHFAQPHRDDVWRYDGFGPFVFSRAQYEAALSQVIDKADS